MACQSPASSPTNLSSLALLTLLAVALLADTGPLPPTAKALRVVKKMGERERTAPLPGRLGGDNGPHEGPGTGNSPQLDSPPGGSQFTVTRWNNYGSYSYIPYTTPGGYQPATDASDCSTVVYNCPNQLPGSSQYTVTSRNADGSYSYVAYNTPEGDQQDPDTSGCTVVSSCSPP